MNQGEFFTFFMLVPDMVKVISEQLESKKISNDQELIQSDPISWPQNQKGKN